MKICSRCKVEKPSEQFWHGNSGQDLQAYCKDCNKLRKRFIRANYTKEQAEKERLDRLAYNRRIRLEALCHYSKAPIPFCNCCGETYYEFLAFDHTDGHGHIQRKQLRAGNGLVKWLRKNNYPEGFQVLCHNCNMAKGFYGICPHQRQKLAVAS